MIGKLVDGKGRIARKLRISVTDKCNFACLFCMPHKNEVKWIPQEDILTFEEIIRITKVHLLDSHRKELLTDLPLRGKGYNMDYRTAYLRNHFIKPRKPQEYYDRRTAKFVSLHN